MKEPIKTCRNLKNLKEPKFTCRKLKEPNGRRRNHKELLGTLNVEPTFDVFLRYETESVKYHG